jgi:hypothetical protein
MSKPILSAVKGRAITAPPLARLLPVIGICASIVAPIAQAAPPPSVAVVKTNPSSEQAFPAHSTTPLVFGGEESPETTVVRPRRAGSSPLASGVGPNNKVFIYTDSACSGTPLAEGTMGQFENSGIEVTVLPNSKTDFYATQMDPAEPGVSSECPSDGFPYFESTTVFIPPGEEPAPGGGAEPTGGTPASGGSAPPAAPRIHTVPGGRANDNTPTILGSAPGATAVRIFATPNCAGAVVAKGSPEDLAVGLEVQVADNSVNSFSAFSLVGGNQSACSAPVSYVEDSTAPRTRITMGPGVKTRKHKAVFRFADTTEDPPDTVFLCQVNHKKWAQCSSPFKLRHLHAKAYVLRVKATDSAGNAEAKGAKRRFKVIAGS